MASTYLTLQFENTNFNHSNIDPSLPYGDSYVVAAFLIKT